MPGKFLTLLLASLLLFPGGVCACRVEADRCAAHSTIHCDLCPSTACSTHSHACPNSHKGPQPASDHDDHAPGCPASKGGSQQSLTKPVDSQLSIALDTTLATVPDVTFPHLHTQALDFQPGSLDHSLYLTFHVLLI